MTKQLRRVPLEGSEYRPLGRASSSDEESGNTRLRVTVSVRRARPLPSLCDDPDWALLLPHERPTTEEAAFAADPEDIALVEEFARESGLEVRSSSAAKCRVELSGTQDAFARAFGVDFVQFEHPRGRHRGYQGSVHLPENLDGVVTGVFGLHNRPRAGAMTGLSATDGKRRTILQWKELEAIYDFPSGTGKGQRIGIIELGGGCYPSDLDRYFESGTSPNITFQPVGQGSNQPATRKDTADLMRWLSDIADGKTNGGSPPAGGKDTVEVTMDIEIAGALAPDAEIIVYFAENSDQGLVDAMDAALDPEGHLPSVLSLSWSWNEHHDQLERHVNERLLEAAHKGITFCVASGDFGSRGIAGASEPEDVLHPQFPPTSPYALACGGTRLNFSEGRLQSEVAWSTDIGMSSGGGISNAFDLPDWQKGHGVPEAQSGFVGRGVPDVAADADPIAHCLVYAGDEWGPAAGTSAAAPLWAALIARLNESLDAPVGYLNPLLYRLTAGGRQVVRDIVSGSNGAYSSAPGWDACTGLGTPRGSELLKALRGE